MSRWSCSHAGGRRPSAGMFEDVSYDEVTIHARSGDVFVFFSDGIVDASNAR
ncbi:MAG TPA: SpoIIE family protein phosphatase, partial [Alphaproteobacteria bacterium]|nr:SpoIIE family protein phosphatase [Alphaproteobacteria bacterium]